MQNGPAQQYIAGLDAMYVTAADNARARAALYLSNLGPLSVQNTEVHVPCTSRTTYYIYKLPAGLRRLWTVNSP
jgi:hypothetical protein